MFRVIKEAQPEWVIGENVRNFISISEGMVFEQTCLDLESEGYEVQTFGIPAEVSMPHTKDTECGLSTPNVSNATASNSMEINMPVEYIREQSGIHCMRKEQERGLSEAERCGEVFERRTLGQFDRFMNTIRKPRKKSSGGQKPPLSQEVLMYPTPLSRDYKDTITQKPSKKQKKLIDAVREQMWPTPTANEDACGKPTGKMQKMLGNHPDVRSQGNGTLNPMWVEWLMGYPIGWTDLKD